MSAPYYADELVTVLAGDCRDVLPTLDDASVDAVVCDPPYGLGFMGKDWDSPGGTGDFPMRRFDAINTVNTGASRQGGRQRSTVDFAKRQARDARAYGAWCEQWATECLRVLKPGGHLLAFGGTRTYHRLACAVEDAGFEIRDSISWLYGSGFPKSLDVSKAIDKLAGEWRGRAGEVASANGSMSGANYGRTDKGEPITAAAAAAAAGWGTALKPAHEPIVVGRKSLAGTVAANVLAHGTGALNIDGCRIERGADDRTEYGRDRHLPHANTTASPGAFAEVTPYEPHGSGRWPTNVLLDESQAEALDAQSGAVRSSGIYERGARGIDPTDRPGGGATIDIDGHLSARYGDTGGASRFFPTFHYEPKAPTSERPTADGVLHPTVKPLDLMRWLVRLVTPPGGLVLDPFLGSGTTAEACVIEGFRCIGIERETDYLPLIVARLSKPIAAVLDFGEVTA